MKTGYFTALVEPLHVPIFRALWIATVVSNIGTLMHAVGAAWLMTSLTHSPLLVALVPTATLAPALLFGLWGGVLADLVDRRRVLIVTQSIMMFVALIQGVLTLANQMSSFLLLSLTFCLGLASALNLPAWQSQIQDIVPRSHIAAAVSLNSMSFNTARAIGPAIGGLIIAVTGIATVFLLNALSFLGTVFVLVQWKRPSLPTTRTPVLRVLWEGISYILEAHEMRAPLVRVTIFSFGASAIWAILPLLARKELHLGPSGYGTLLAAFGIGSLTIGSLVPGLRRIFKPDQIAIVSIFIFTGTLLCLSWTKSWLVLLIALFAGGSAWSGTLVQFLVAVQTAAPPKIRGRAMSFYIVFFQGSMGLGSAINGWISGQFGIRSALIVAACLIFLGFPLRYIFPLSPHDQQPVIGEETL